jgi:hypothetical protein
MKDRQPYSSPRLLWGLRRQSRRPRLGASEVSAEQESVLASLRVRLRPEPMVPTARVMVTDTVPATTRHAMLTARVTATTVRDTYYRGGPRYYRYY